MSNYLRQQLINALWRAYNEAVLNQWQEMGIGRWIRNEFVFECVLEWEWMQ